MLIMIIIIILIIITLNNHIIIIIIMITAIIIIIIIIMFIIIIIIIIMIISPSKAKGVGAPPRRAGQGVRFGTRDTPLSRREPCRMRSESGFDWSVGEARDSCAKTSDGHPS